MVIQTISDWGELQRERDALTAAEGQTRFWPELRSGRDLHCAEFPQELWTVFVQKSFMVVNNIYLSWNSGWHRSRSRLYRQRPGPAVALSATRIYLLILSSSCSSQVCRDAINAVRFTEIKGNLGTKEALKKLNLEVFKSQQERCKQLFCRHFSYQ